jgi:hypothetical protein
MYPPMTGAHAATIAATPSGSAPMIHPGASGMYSGAPAPLPKKSKAGLIIGLVAVLAVAGGVTGLVIANKGGGGGSGSGSDPGSGSQIAHNGSGSSGQAGVNPPPVSHDAGAAGSGTTAGSGGTEPVNHPPEPVDAGTTVAVVDPPDAAITAPPPRADVVEVRLFDVGGARFTVYEKGQKVLDGPGNLEVGLGETRTVVVKAPGYKDRKLVVQGVKKNVVQFTLTRIGAPPHAGSGNHVGSGAVTPPDPPVRVPTGPDCSRAIVDTHSKACVDQYCKANPKDGNCEFLR